MTDKERYQDLKNRGICVYCKTAPAEDGKTTCRICREKQRKQTSEKRAALKKLGFCTECGQNRIFESERICPECAAKKYADNLKRKDAERDREYQHNLRERCKAAGICVKCRKRKAETGKTRCITCNIKERERARQYRGGIPRHERPAYGMCYFCGAAITTGKVCESCKERIIKNLPDEPVPNENWRQADRARVLAIQSRYNHTQQ
jgi:hypothetical protein